MAAVPLIEILLVEDNTGNLRLTLRPFRDTELSSHFNVVRDGEETLTILRRTAVYTRAPRRVLILLNLKMPKKDRRGLLRDVKTDPMLKTIPVIVLTTSAAPIDIPKSHYLNTNFYIQKPTGFDELLESARKLASLWFGVVQLPAAPKGTTA
jgi:two-component system, chemotaxis family, response regulator Rcp1